MNTKANLRVRISADLADIRQGLQMLRGELATVKRQSERATPNLATQAWSRGLAAVRSQLVGIVSVYGAMRAGGAYIKLADEAANLSGRLRLATKSQAEFNRAQEQTFAIAQDTSAEWGSIVGLYSQLAQTTGMGQERILALTKTISQAFTVSGASAQETANGLRQLQQAMAGGVLRAEEFNTIIETSPRIVQALADHFGIAFGQVRKYVNDGKITSEEFARALLKSSGDIQADFDKMPLTVARAVQQVRNALLKLVGDTDTAQGASKNLANAIAELADTLEDPRVKQGFADLVSGAAGATEAIARLLPKLKELADGEMKKADEVGQSFQDTLHHIAKAQDDVRASMRSLNDFDIVGYFSAAANAAADYARALRASFGAQTRPDFSNVVSRILLPDFSNVTSGVVSGDGAGSNPATTTAGKAVAESNALVRDAVSRALKELDRLYAEHEVGIQAYFAKRLELQQASIDAEIAQARMQMRVTKDAGQRRDLEERIAILQRDRAELAVNSLRDEKKANEELDAAMDEYYIRRIENEGRLADAVRARLEAENKDRISQLQASGRHDEVRVIRLDIDAEVAKAQLQQFENQMTQTLARLQATEMSISTQMSAGTLGMIAGETQLRQAREAALIQLVQMREKATAALQAMSPDDPGAAAALQYLQQLGVNIADVSARLDEYRNKVKDAATDAVTNLFMDLVDGSKSASEALRDFVTNFAMSMAQIAARALATMLVLRAMDAVWPGSSALLIAGAKAGQYHTGGIVGSVGGIQRHMPAWMFGEAPRYHGGGIAGMKPNEVPAILERGEEVLTRNDPRHRNNLRGDGGGGGQTPVTVIAAFSEAELANAATGKAFEQVVIAHVRNNSRALGIG